MPLQLTTGPATAGFTSVISDAIGACVGDGGRAQILVPSAPDVSRATEWVAQGFGLGVGVSTFDDYLDRLWNEVGDGRAIAAQAQRLVVMEESVRMWRPETVVLPEGSPGLARTLLGAAQRAAEAQWDERHAADRGVGGDLLRCLLIYERMLAAAGFIERAAAHRLVCERVGAIEMPDFLAVDGFTGFTTAQESFVLGASSATDVMVSLVHMPGRFVTAATRALAERLSVDAETRILEAEEDPGKPLCLRLLDERLGEPGLGSADPASALVLSEAWGRRAEAARVVREVQDAVESGIPAERVAVVVRDPGAWARAFRATFAEADVPVEIDARVPYGESPLGRAIVLMLGLREEGAPYEQLMDLLRTPFAPPADALLDDLDVQLRRTGQTDVRAAREWLRRRAPQAAAFVSDAVRACGKVGTPSAEKAWYGIVAAMLARAYGPAAGDTREVRLDAAAARGLLEALRGVAALGVRAATGEVVAAALRETPLYLQAEDTPGYVQIMGPERVRGRRYDCVIIAGLNLGEFPRPAGDDALSSPGVAAAFARAGIDVGSRAGIEAERLLFYMAVTRADKRLVLSWQSHDAEGRPLRRSPFLDEVMDVFRDSTTGAFAGEGPARHVLGLDCESERPDGLRSQRRSLRGVAEGAGGSGRARAYGAPRACAEVRDALRGRTVFSASEIEMYLQCRFRWFITRVVQPRELDERLDRAAEGAFAHEIMRRFYDELNEAGHSRVTEETLDVALETHERAVAAALEEVRPGTAAECARIRTIIRRTEGLVRADADLLPGMVPSHREWSFGADGAGVDVGPFELSGRVDRIDTDGAHFVVTDYKSGSVGPERGLAHFEDGGLVQLPLYAAVVALQLGLAPTGGIYRPLSGAKPRGFVSDVVSSGSFVSTDRVRQEDVSAVLDAAVEQASAAIGEMREGDIHPSPRGGTCPAYCPARSFCSEWRPGRG